MVGKESSKNSLLVFFAIALVGSLPTLGQNADQLNAASPGAAIEAATPDTGKQDENPAAAHPPAGILANVHTAKPEQTAAQTDDSAASAAKTSADEEQPKSGQKTRKAKKDKKAGPAQTGAINLGKLIDDKQDPRYGFIVVDEDRRLSYIKNATIWRPFDLKGADLSQGQSLGTNKAGLPKTLPNDKVVVCDFKLKELGGTTPKFNCDHIEVYNTVEDAAKKQNAIPHALKKAKVRYSDTSKNAVKPYSTVIATRVAWALGFFADIETPVQEVICNGCTKDPFHQKAPAVGKSFTFTTASLEQHEELIGIIGINQRGKDITFEKAKGPEAAWYWKEGEANITDPDRRAQFEALELLAAFLKDGDNKAVQNRLGCLPEDFDKKTGICNVPVMVVHDFGNTLGSDGLKVHPLNFESWSKAKIWDDPKTCKAAIRNNIGNGSGLDHPIIHQAGLKLLADSLQGLIADDENLLAIFSASKIEQYDDHGSRHTAREWADLFKKRAQTIIDSHCEP